MATDIKDVRDRDEVGINPNLASSGKQAIDAFIDGLIKYGAVKEEDSAGLREKYQTPEDVFSALERFKPDDEEKLVKAYADYRRVGFTELKKISPDVFATLPRALAERYQIVPYELENRLMKVAVAQPTRLARGDLSVLRSMEEKSGLKIEVNYATRAAVQKALKETVPAPNAVSSQKAALPRADLSNINISSLVINKLPRDIAEQYGMVVFESLSPTRIKVGMVDPTSQKARDLLDFIREKNKIEIKQYVISAADFKNALHFYEQRATLPDEPSPPSPPPAGTVNFSAGATATHPSNTASTAMATLKAGDEETNLDVYLREKLITPDDLSTIIKTGNVPKMVAGIIKLASLMKSSDVHIEAAKELVLIRYRIDGKLREIVKVPVGFQKSVVARVKILAKLKIDEARIPQDGRFEVTVAGHSVDLRVSVMPAIYGEKIVLRLLDKNAGIFELKSLGMNDRDLKLIVKGIEKPYGVLLVTGPTGSGKSTTLYAGINHLKGPTINIVTLEDPVEYEIAGINQVQVKPHIGFTFAEGLRAVLRQDPNIIMVGEIRDAETANLVTHAALTGHVVLTTLHTNNAAGAMPRLINMGVEPFLISSAVNAIVAQRLVRKICPSCRAETQVPPEVRAEAEKEFAQYHISQPIRFYQGKGCPKCDDGYKGRTGIYEVLEVSDEIEDLIIKRAPASQILDVAIKQGMTTMRLDGLLKVAAGITTIEEVMQATMLN